MRHDTAAAVAFQLVRSFNTGPAGTLLVIVGLMLAASSLWTAITKAGWPQLLPSMLIGLSLVAVGYSLVARGRRARSRSDGPDRENL
jgi:hypothetical protein